MAHGKYSAGSSTLPFPKIATSHRFIAKALGATMWFWVFYRLREEGPVMLGWRKPWEHAHHEEHAEEH